MKTKIVKYLANEMQTPLQEALNELKDAKNRMVRDLDDPKHPSWNVYVAYEKLETLEKILDLLR